MKEGAAAACPRTTFFREEFMVMFRWCLSTCLALVLAVAGRPGMAAAAEQASIGFVKYAQLGDLVKKQRGKIVVVDFWNIY